ncbi:zinc finger protein 426 [Nilaparvata lugens]|uniref:zinc finger protein 426 n=1 Tax=Nilaparvata lugens TaxID=108931 RepID=UPI00193E6B51|nr:zinc finger protein 426 [Nilaparvata lugens]
MELQNEETSIHCKKDRIDDECDEEDSYHNQSESCIGLVQVVLGEEENGDIELSTSTDSKELGDTSSEHDVITDSRGLHSIFSPTPTKTTVSAHFSCVHCDHICTDEGEHRIHVRSHKGEKLFNCELCDYKSARPTDLDRHLRTHTGLKPFRCKFCDYQTKRSDALKLHIRRHTGEKPYVCQFCDYRCADPSVFKCHIKIHTNDKAFVCKVCNYRCIRSNDLNRHMKTHTGEKPISCDLCDFRTTRPNALRNHLASKHSQEYSCEFCDYKGTLFKELKLHLATHPDYKPYACDVCPYSFCYIFNIINVIDLPNLFLLISFQ